MAPKVVPIIFPGNELDAQIRQFLTSLQGSAWWRAATAEYGVGAITTLPVYVPTDPPPTLDTVDQWVTNLAANPPAGLAAPDDNTIYAIVLPPGWQQEAGACVTFGAGHWNSTVAGSDASAALCSGAGRPSSSPVRFDERRNERSRAGSEFMRSTPRQSV